MAIVEPGVADADPDLPPARGAIGYGSVYARGGDYFGTLVNLVARAVKVAQPGHLVVSPEVVASLGHFEFTLGTAEQHTLRGIDHPIGLTPRRYQDKQRGLNKHAHNRTGAGSLRIGRLAHRIEMAKANETSFFLVTMPGN